MKPLILTYTLFCLTAFFACGQSSATQNSLNLDPDASTPNPGFQTSDETNIDGFHIKILESDGSCNLQYNKNNKSSILNLGAKPNCKFVNWKVKEIKPKYGEIIYQKDEKLMVHDFDKIPQIKAKVIAVYGGFAKDNTCKSGFSAAETQLIFIKQYEILTGGVSETNNFKCTDKIFELFIAEPDFMFRAERELNQAVEQ